MLINVDTNIWIAEGECVNFHGFPYPTRCVIIKLSNGNLWVWSPIALSESLKKEVDLLGTPQYLISPNKIHHLFLDEWLKAYPDSKLWGPRSTIEKRKDLPFAGSLTNDAPVEWREEIDQVWFNGSAFMDEIVFFHHASKTVIMADLSENFSTQFLEENWSWWQQILGKLWGIVEGKGYAPLEWRLSFLKRRATRQARDRVFNWEPEKVIMAHGTWQQSNGLAFLKKSFSWM